MDARSSCRAFFRLTYFICQGNKEVDTGPLSPVEEKKFYPTFHRNSVKSFDQIQEFAAGSRISRSFELIDARSAGRFNGTEPVCLSVCLIYLFLSPSLRLLASLFLYECILTLINLFQL
jgi:hypothetical protein